jgi:uncharacterized protein YndB with AHSA1/START domain
VRAEKDVLIARAAADVFDFVADPLNDPRWCPKVKSCEQVEGEGPGPGARYRATHQPTRIKPAAAISVEVTEFDRPRRVRLREEDDDGVFEVTYLLEPEGDGTRFRQRSDVDWKLPKPLQLLGNLMVPRHLEGQMRALKRELEGTR